MAFKAVLFDMDGVLIDSELYWVRASMRFLAKYNIALTPELTAQMTGRSLHESVSILKEKFNLKPSVEELLGEKKAHSEAIYNFQAHIMPGARELLETLKQEGFVTAIASGSSLERIMKIVHRFGWEKYFDALISTDHVNLKGKPDPAIYEYTSMSINIEPEACVVIEDSVNGVRSAHGARMKCVAVPDPRWSWGDFSEADLVATSLRDENLLRFIGAM